MIVRKQCAHKGCKVLGVGPRAQKLWPMGGRLWCREHFGDALGWEANREAVVQGIEYAVEQDRALAARRHQKPVVPPKRDWRGYFHECCAMAGWALEVDDRRTFVHYFSRALYALTLKEIV